MKTINVTVKEFAQKHGIPALQANSVLHFMVKQGNGKIHAAPKVAGQKGKPANIFELPEEISIKA